MDHHDEQSFDYAPSKKEEQTSICDCSLDYIEWNAFKYLVLTQKDPESTAAPTSVLPSLHIKKRGSTIFV